MINGKVGSMYLNQSTVTPILENRGEISQKNPPSTKLRWTEVASPNQSKWKGRNHWMKAPFLKQIGQMKDVDQSLSGKDHFLPSHPSPFSQ